MLIWRLLICHRSDNRQEKIWKASANSCENMIEWQKIIEYAESVIRYCTPLVSQRNNPVATRQLIAKFEPNRVSHSLGLEGPMLPLPIPPSTRLSPSTSPIFPPGVFFFTLTVACCHMRRLSQQNGADRQSSEAVILVIHQNGERWRVNDSSFCTFGWVRKCSTCTQGQIQETWATHMWTEDTVCYREENVVWLLVGTDTCDWNVCVICAYGLWTDGSIDNFFDIINGKWPLNDIVRFTNTHRHRDSLFNRLFQPSGHKTK